MAYEWVSDAMDYGAEAAAEAGEAIVGAGSTALDYLNNNEWAANAVAGGAEGAMNYMAQKDAQKFKERQQERRWSREDSLSKAPNIDASKYSYGLTDGPMTDGGLINRARQ